MGLPRMYRIRQRFDRRVVNDIKETLDAELGKLALPDVIKPGQRVAITGGSRGIANIAHILKVIVQFLKPLGTEPFLFPAMGSHGGATAAGQIALLAHLGVTEAYLEVPILASMEVAEIGRTEDGVPVFVDRIALSADHIIVVNRIKSHTKFKAPIESGLMKMMAIGMGKQRGADVYHRAAIQYTFPRIIVDAARVVLRKAPIRCGVGIVENGYGETAKIAVLRPEELERAEKELLILSKRMMPKLPFDVIDLLIVDEMGKDISGVGIDPNITGRNRDLLGGFAHSTIVKRLFARDLTDKSNGNATGIGLADFATKRLVDKMDHQTTYMNCITGLSPEKAAIPMHFETDREAIEVALGSFGLISPRKAKIMRVKNTLQLEDVEVSEAYEEELFQRPDLDLLEGPTPMTWTSQGNLS